MTQLLVIIPVYGTSTPEHPGKDIKPSLKTWPRLVPFYLFVINLFSEVYIISVICDPVKRLLSDFVHVTDGHGSAEWLDKDSSLFPFANLTFDEMVSKHLSKAREIFETGKPEKWKQFPLYGRSSISYFKRQRIIINR
jgi:hypothetical protein